VNVALTVLGGAVVCMASVLAGVTGFGSALVSTPLLLLAGLPLAQVVVVNLVLLLATRVAVVLRLRRHVDPRRAGFLVLGCIPGLLLGAVFQGAVDPVVLKVVAGAVAVVVAALLMLRPGEQTRPEVPRATPVQWALSGGLGGFLGITTSLSGPPPVMLLARQHAEPRGFVADLAVYFVFCSGAGLLLLQLGSDLAWGRLGLLLAFWLPVAIGGNALGLRYNARLPTGAFRVITLSLVMAAGVTTVVTSITG
jgi:uncharacterized membrane protein YfcA